MGDPGRQFSEFEVIDERGRVCRRFGCTVHLSYQEDGRRLKVFVNRRPTIEETSGEARCTRTSDMFKG